MLKEYYKWRLEQGKLTDKEYTSIVRFQEEIEVELTEEQLKKLNDLESK